jgi:protein-L-isoaspartate(D-aspartate) O-methyltransferase
MKRKSDPTDASCEEKRQEMVRSQIKARGVKNPLVLQAMQTVPRHEFVPEDRQDMAYSDRPLPIGHGQTISQPYIVAYMTELLRLGGGEKVLEIGTGFGYQSAVLASIAKEVYTVECVPELSEKAQKLFRTLGYDTIHCRTGDGTKGWPEQAPYEGILVTAAGPDIPETLKNQLALGAHLVMPVGEYRFGQRIVRLTRGGGDTFHLEKFLDVAFVPLIGQYGWEQTDGL